MNIIRHSGGRCILQVTFDISSRSIFCRFIGIVLRNAHHELHIRAAAPTRHLSMTPSAGSRWNPRRLLAVLATLSALLIGSTGCQYGATTEPAIPQVSPTQVGTSASPTPDPTLLVIPHLIRHHRRSPRLRLPSKRPRPPQRRPYQPVQRRKADYATRTITAIATATVCTDPSKLPHLQPVRPLAVPTGNTASVNIGKGPAQATVVSRNGCNLPRLLLPSRECSSWVDRKLWRDRRHPTHRCGQFNSLALCARI
jgi:hypothetical protein